MSFFLLTMFFCGGGVTKKTTFRGGAHAVPTKVTKKMFNGTKVPTGAGVSFFPSYFFLERNYNTALLFIITVCSTFSYFLFKVPRSLSEFSFPVLKSVLRTCPGIAHKAPTTTVTTSTFRIAQTVVNIYLTL